MGYQSSILGAVGSLGTGISIASMLYRQSPEYQAKVEKEKLKMKAVVETEMVNNEIAFDKATAGKQFAWDKEAHRPDKSSVVSTAGTGSQEANKAAYNAHKKSIELAKMNYAVDPNQKYIDSALSAKSYMTNANMVAERARQVMDQAKEQKRKRLTSDNWSTAFKQSQTNKEAK